MKPTDLTRRPATRPCSKDVFSCCRFETETVAPLCRTWIAISPTDETTAFGSACQGQACRRRVDTGTGLRLLNLVSDGTKAVQAIIRWTYDAALTGIRLRNIDGADTTAAIRDLPSEHKLTTSYAFVGALKLSNAVNILVFARSGEMDGATSGATSRGVSDCAYKAL